MLTRSAKNKGKRLEKWIAAQVRAAYPLLTDDDVRVNIGAETGEDLKLSSKAKHVFPYSVEAKNRETFKTLYGFYKQAAQHPGEPLLVIKMNHEEPLAILNADYFFELIKKGQTNG